MTVLPILLALSFASLTSEDPAVRACTARALAAAGDRAAAGELRQALARENNLSAFREIATALVKLAGPGEARRVVSALMGYVRHLEQSIEKAQKNVRELEQLAREAESPPTGLPGYTSAAGFRSTARQFRMLIQKCQGHRSIAQQKIAILRRVGEE